MEARVIAKNVSVKFPIYGTKSRSLKSSLIDISTGGILSRDVNENIIVNALSEINLDLKVGDRLGLTGHNGSGKTTLLRVLSGVYYPSSGSLLVEGKVATLLDIGLGMDGEATGYENIRVRGLLMGMTASQLDKKMVEIAEFSGLGQYLDMPMRTYSSGMIVRLGFAISTCGDFEILLMDEWLSVGDAEFQEKATNRLNEMVSKTSILVLASHSVELLEKTCNKIIVMEHGRIVEFLS